MTNRADDEVRHDRQGAAAGWVYWGATGLLQPLSEEFLYRSPADRERRARCRLLAGKAEVTHAVR